LKCGPLMIAPFCATRYSTPYPITKTRASSVHFFSSSHFSLKRDLGFCRPTEQTKEKQEGSKTESIPHDHVSAHVDDPNIHHESTIHSNETNLVRVVELLQTVLNEIQMLKQDVELMKTDLVKMRETSERDRLRMMMEIEQLSHDSHLLKEHKSTEPSPLSHQR
jgi:hypothetical protein